MITIKTKILALLSLLGLLFFTSDSPTKKNFSGVHFKPDGAKFYGLNFKGLEVIECNLPIIWDLSSAEFSAALDVSAQTPTPEYIAVESDGTKLWLTERTSTRVFEYGFSTPWKLRSAFFLVAHEPVQ